MVELQAGETLAASAQVEPPVRDLLARHRATEFDAWLGFPLITLGERDRALDLLEVAPGRPGFMWILRLPEFDVLRSHPRFQRIVEESQQPKAPK